MPQGAVGVSGYTRRSATGKVVHVKKYTQKRDLVAEMNALGRSQVAAQPGQMPGGRSVPLAPGVSKEQLKLQKAQVAALRKQVKALRAANPEVASQVESTRSQMGKTVAARSERDAKKASKEKELSKAEKLKSTRGADPEKVKQAEETLKKAVETETNRKAAAEKAAKTKAEKAAAEAERTAIKPLTQNERSAVKQYGYKLYGKLNWALRRNQFFGISEQEVANYTKEIDSAIAKSPLQEDKTLYRGVSFSALGLNDAATADIPFEPGTIFEDSAYVSTSADNGEILAPFGEITLQMDLPKGFPALDMVGRGTNDEQFEDEQEFLLPRGIKMEVISDTGGNGAGGPGERVIQVRVTLPEGAANGDGQEEAGQAGGEKGPSQEEGTGSVAGVSGPDDVGAGGRESDAPPKEVSDLTPDDLKTLAQTPDLRGMGLSERAEILGPQIELANKVWGGDHNGFEFVVVRARPEPDLGEITYSGDIKDAEGKVIGQFGRAIRGTEVKHQTLTLDPSVQGQGTAHAFNKAAETHYRALGLKKVSLGTQDIGGYAWARAGFDWNYSDKDDLEYDVSQILDSINRDAESLLDGDDLTFYESVQDQLDELRHRLDEYKYGDDEALPDDFPTPFELSQIGYVPGDTSWPGKTGMIGMNWSGKKML